MALFTTAIPESPIFTLYGYKKKITLCDLAALLSQMRIRESPSEWAYRLLYIRKRKVLRGCNIRGAFKNSMHKFFVSAYGNTELGNL